jgi:dihydrofolate synthase/folylpolyglutamate synthase
MRDKAVDEIAGLLFPHAATVILTQPRQPRAISAGELARLTRHLAQDLQVVEVPEEAVEEALDLAAPDDAIFITGSLYLVGDLRRWWTRRNMPQRAAL